MAEIVRRRSWGGVLPLGRHVSISGSSFIQCASASIAPPHPGGAKCYPGAEIQGRTGPRPTFKVPYQTGLSAAGFDAPDKSAIGKKYDSPATVMWHGDMVGADGVITSMVPSSKTGDDVWLRPGPSRTDIGYL